MDTAELLQLVADEPVRHLAPGDTVIHAGQVDPGVHVLVSGVLDIERGGHRIARLDAPGAIVGEMSFLLDGPATADVVAVEASVLHRVRDAEELAGRPEFSRHLAETLARRLQRVASYLDDLQRQFEDRAGTLGLVPTVLADLLSTQRPEPEPGSERERDSPY